jgi:hypothetical protein
MGLILAKMPIYLLEAAKALAGKLYLYSLINYQYLYTERCLVCQIVVSLKKALFGRAVRPRLSG